MALITNTNAAALEKGRHFKSQRDDGGQNRKLSKVDTDLEVTKKIIKLLF